MDNKKPASNDINVGPSKLRKLFHPFSRAETGNSTPPAMFPAIPHLHEILPDIVGSQPLPNLSEPPVAPYRPLPLPVEAAMNLRRPFVNPLDYRKGAAMLETTPGRGLPLNSPRDNHNGFDLTKTISNINITLPDQTPSGSAPPQDDADMTGQSSPVNEPDISFDSNSEQKTQPHISDSSSTSTRRIQQTIMQPSITQRSDLHSAPPMGPFTRRFVHEASGYTWEKEEDAPGYAWKNRKAKEEHARAMEQIVDKDKMIGRSYGDIGNEGYE